MKRERYERSLRRRYAQSMWLLDRVSFHAFSDQSQKTPSFRPSRPIKMSLGPGGSMKEPIYRDRYGIDAWDQSVSSRCFVTLADARQWEQVTGLKPPTEPPTAKDYAEVGLPWFDYDDPDQDARAGSPELAVLDSVESRADKLGMPLKPVGPVDPSLIAKRGPGA